MNLSFLSLWGEICTEVVQMEKKSLLKDNYNILFFTVFYFRVKNIFPSATN